MQLNVSLQQQLDFKYDINIRTLPKIDESNNCYEVHHCSAHDIPAVCYKLNIDFNLNRLKIFANDFSRINHSLPFQVQHYLSQIMSHVFFSMNVVTTYL